MNRDILVTIIVATYNPDYKKLEYTINSIFRQQRIDFEIIIADDGSSNWDDSWFEEKSARQCRILKHTKNVGTVRNVYDALKISNGKYIKLISPGDALTTDMILKEWCDYTASSGRTWSFGDAIYYVLNEGERVLVREKTSPQNIRYYQDSNDEMCRWNYIIHNDSILGAATLCEKTILLKYLEKVVGKVRYGEDFAYRLMMFDGEVPAYFSKNVVTYENGTGISTIHNTEWESRLSNDLQATDLVMLEKKEDVDSFQKKILSVYKWKKCNYGKKTRIFSLFIKGQIRMMIRRYLFPRISMIDEGYI